jgi:helicase associated protein
MGACLQRLTARGLVAILKHHANDYFCRCAVLEGGKTILSSKMDFAVSRRIARSWQESFVALEQFKAREDHCNVPRGKVEGFVKLGRWVRTQRANQGKLTALRRKRLDAIGFIWNLRDQAWEEGYSALGKFGAREGHCCVPQHHIEGVFRLGQWVNLLRTRQKKLHVERKRRLDSVGFIWDKHKAYWDDMYSRLMDYKIKHGDCNVSCNHSDKLLVCWVVHQRSRKGGLCEERRDRLNRLGFIWTPFDEAWQRGFSALKKFKSREGHCLVPEAHAEGAYNLGAWAKEQRRRKNAMAASRRRQLNAIGF